MTLAHIKAVTRRLFWESDTTAVHLILASASCGWCWSMFFQDPPTHSQVFRLMFLIHPYIWGVAFALHIVLVNLCLYSEKYNKRCSIFVHSYGVALWLTMTLALNLAVKRFTPSTSLEWTICAFALWALFRARADK